MRPNLRRTTILFRVFATLLALPHFYLTPLFPFFLFGLACKLAGVEGDPLDISGHPHLRTPSEGEIWTRVLVGTFATAATGIYGALLVMTSWRTGWRDSRRVCVATCSLAVICGIGALAFWVWLVAVVTESERSDFLLFGGPLLLLYLAGNVAVAIAFSKGISAHG